VIGARTVPQTVLIQNIGQQALTMSGVDTGSSFQAVSPLPSAIPPGQTANLDLVFRPIGEGDLATLLTITSNSAEAPAPVVLRGTGLAQPLLVPTPSSAEFETTPVGGRSGERTIVLRSQGVQPAVLNAVRLGGTNAADFVMSGNTCGGSTLRSEQTCQVTVVMAPLNAGARQAFLEVEFFGPLSPLRVPLSGDADAGAALVPQVSELDFGPIAAMTGGRALKLGFENRGVGPAQVQGFSLSGQNAAEFSITADECSGATLAAGGRCSISLLAQPQTPGPRSATLVIRADVPSPTVTLRAEGLAIKAEWSVAALEFGNIRVGGRSPRQDAQLFNTGDTTLVVNSIQVEGDFEVQDVVPQINRVPPDQAKYFRVWFVPKAAGAQSGRLHVHCDPPGSTYSVPLTGVGL
jgi:hypothetical protein